MCRDRSLRWRVKGVLGVPLSATNSYLYCPTNAGGVGLTHFAREADLQLVAATHHLLHSTDPAVAELHGAVRRRVRQRDPSRLTWPHTLFVCLLGFYGA